MKNEIYPYFLSEDEFISFWKEYFKNNPDKKKDYLTLYLHYPWCNSICKFCVFGQYNYHSAKDIIGGYEKRTIHMISKVSKLFDELDIAPSELYLGGGTASLWTLETLENIKKSLNIYDNIKLKNIEIHPSDLTDEKIDFYINKMKFERVSIGIQTFDINALINQHRMPADVNKLRNAVRKFQKNGIEVNIDIIAMINGDEDNNWEVFINDLEILVTDIKPDSIYCGPNFKSENYYEISIMLREKLIKFLNTHNECIISNDFMLSLNYKDIILFRDNPYVLYLNKEMIDEKANKDNEITIGIGGINNFNAISKTPNGHYIECRYIPFDNEFVYYNKHNMENSNNPYETAVRIGSCKIKPPKIII